jgi:hypothetical protein
MSGKTLWRAQVVLLLGLLNFFFPPASQATVYSWQHEDGVLMLSNDPEAIPEAKRETAKKFTSKFAGKSAPAAVAPEVAPPSPPSPEESVMSSYERGLERGLQTAAQQVAMAGELARTVIAAAPRTPPTRIIIQQSAPVVRYTSPGYDFPYYGFIGPYAPYFPYGYSYGYGFRRGRFVRHSHFFPGTRGRRHGIFFPHGHFSQSGFLFGHGFVVR